MFFRHPAIPPAATTAALRQGLARRIACASLILGAATAVAGHAEAAVDGAMLRPSTSPAMTLVHPPAATLDWSALGSMPSLAPAAAIEAPVLLASQQRVAPKPAARNSLSGLPWKSGSQCYSEAFENYRGRRADVNSLYLGQSSWALILKNLRNSATRAAQRPPQVIIALAMLVKGQRFSDCNAGKLDGTFRDIGNVLHSGGFDDAIVRLGWEANGTAYAWSIRNEVEPYKACFRRLVGILRRQAPQIHIEWSMRKDNAASVSADKLYPGDDVVDIIGTSFYDRYPSTNNQSQWDAAYRQTKQGGPRGLGTWLAFAKSRGKKLALAEWAVSDGYSNSGSKDNPFFIEKVFQFLRANASSIAYEAYFNCKNTNPDTYMIFPEYRNPKASAKYKQLWRAGA
jgi:hypothetical protein